MEDQQQALVIEAKDGLGPASGQSPEALPSSRSSGIADLTLSRVHSMNFKVIKFKKKLHLL